MRGELTIDLRWRSFCLQLAHRDIHRVLFCCSLTHPPAPRSLFPYRFQHPRLRPPCSSRALLLERALPRFHPSSYYYHPPIRVIASSTRRCSPTDIFFQFRSPEPSSFYPSFFYFIFFLYRFVHCPPSSSRHRFASRRRRRQQPAENIIVFQR